MKHLTLEIKHKIAFLKWDQKDSLVNLICSDFIKELSLITKKLDPSQVKALVFVSGKRKGFSAGADIKEIQQCKDKQELEAKLNKVNQLFLKFEHLNILKIAAIDGDCLGGGLEWALCFDKILVSDSDSTKLALPEVKLGLIPGFGGCFRLPKRLSLLESLKMICSGKHLNSKKAFQLGLTDELVPQLLLNKRAIELTFELVPELAQNFSPKLAQEFFIKTSHELSFADSKVKSSQESQTKLIKNSSQKLFQESNQKTTNKLSQSLQMGLLKKLKFRFITSFTSKIQKERSFFTKNKYRFNRPYSYWRDFFFCSLICFVFKSKIKEKTKGFYPAPLIGVQLVSKGYRFSISYKLLEQQKEAFIDLTLGKISKNLVSLFLQTRQAKKRLSLLSNDNQNSIQKIGVLGAGVMGRSIAFLLADKGFEVRLIDNNPLALQFALKKWYTSLKKQKEIKKINSHKENYKRNLLSVSQNFWGIKKKDLIIECLPEDLQLKKEMIAFVSKKLQPECLFASNSSSLSIQDLAQSSEKPDQFFSLHFFNPVDKMPLIEICYDETQKEKLSALPSFIQKIGKIPLIVKDSPCFVVNRILVTYVLEALLLLEKGYAVEELDTLFKEKGFPLGPFEIMDKIGLDTCIQVVSNLKIKEAHLKTPEWIEDLTKILGLGEKDQKGFYLYEHHSPYFDIKQLNPKTEILKKGELNVGAETEEIFQKILNQMSETGKNLIQKKVVKNKEDIDMAMVLGSGFPAFMGGLMQQHSKQH